MANITLQGFAGGMILQPGESIEYKRTGIAERISIFKSFGLPADPPIPLYTPYPSANTGGFVCDSTKSVSGPGGWYVTTVVWVSLFAGPTQYTTFDSKLIQVPIDQSPDFTSIAGTPSSPLNGAAFDTNGVFIGFGPGDFQGVISQWVQQDLQIVRGSGFKPATPDPSLFCESITNTLRGGVWEYEITYNLDIDVSTGLPTF